MCESYRTAELSFSKICVFAVWWGKKERPNKYIFLIRRRKADARKKGRMLVLITKMAPFEICLTGTLFMIKNTIDDRNTIDELNSCILF